MIESKLVKRVDRYLRNPDTALAHVFRLLSPESGIDYLKSKQKRALELCAVMPLALASSPIIGVFGIAVKIEGSGDIFYRQDRSTIDNNGNPKVFSMTKIRSMEPNSRLAISSIDVANGISEEEDPRLTRVGKFIRKFHIDELPQFFHVLKGDMSLIGIRALPPYIFQYLRKESGWPDSKFKRWETAYFSDYSGITGLNQAINPRNKEDHTRFPLDDLYNRRASLGLDMYILWRTLIK